MSRSEVKKLSLFRFLKNILFVSFTFSLVSVNCFIALRANSENAEEERFMDDSSPQKQKRSYTDLYRQRKNRLGKKQDSKGFYDFDN